MSALEHDPDLQGDQDRTLDAPTPGVGSLIEELRAEFAKPMQERREFFQFPGVKGLLHGEYRPLTVEAIVAVQNAKPTAELALDTHLKALVDIHVLDPTHAAANDRGYVPLAVKAGVEVGGPLGCDHRLCELVGLPPGTAREIMLRLFDGDESWLVTSLIQLTDWMASTNRDRSEDFEPGS